VGERSVKAWNDIAIKLGTVSLGELSLIDYDDIADRFLNYLQALKEEGERPPRVIGDASKTVSLEDFITLIRRGDRWALNYLRELATAWLSITS